MSYFPSMQKKGWPFMQRSYFSIIGANVVINVVFAITLLLDTLQGTNHKIIKLQLFVLLIALLIITRYHFARRKGNNSYKKVSKIF